MLKIWMKVRGELKYRIEYGLGPQYNGPTPTDDKETTYMFSAMLIEFIHTPVPREVVPHPQEFVVGLILKIGYYAKEPSAKVYFKQADGRQFSASCSDLHGALSAYFFRDASDIQEFDSQN